MSKKNEKILWIIGAIIIGILLIKYSQKFVVVESNCYENTGSYGNAYADAKICYERDFTIFFNERNYIKIWCEKGDRLYVDNPTFCNSRGCDGILVDSPYTLKLTDGVSWITAACWDYDSPSAGCVRIPYGGYFSDGGYCNAGNGCEECFSSGAWAFAAQGILLSGFIYSAPECSPGEEKCVLDILHVCSEDYTYQVQGLIDGKCGYSIALPPPPPNITEIINTNLPLPSDNCVPVCGCHPNDCIHKEEKGECGHYFCSMVCSGLMDCGAGYCAEVNNQCVVVSGKSVYLKGIPITDSGEGNLSLLRSLGVGCWTNPACCI